MYIEVRGAVTSICHKLDEMKGTNVTLVNTRSTRLMNLRIVVSSNSHILLSRELGD